MGNGWGYNANRRTQDQQFIESIHKHFENEKLKVYETPVCLYKGSYLKIRVLFNKVTKSIKGIITGKNFSGNRIKPLEINLTDFKTLKNVKLELYNIINNMELYN